MKEMYIRKDSMQKTFKEIRKEKGITLSHVARLLNKTNATIRNKESFKTEFTASEARALCHLYNIGIDEVRL